jgi:hypothetical protein
MAMEANMTQEDFLGDENFEVLRIDHFGPALDAMRILQDYTKRLDQAGWAYTDIWQDRFPDMEPPSGILLDLLAIAPKLLTSLMEISIQVQKHYSRDAVS